MYDGYVVKDQIYFDENYHAEQNNKIKYTFGCVKRETSIFYTQKADGILGLAPGG